MCLCTRFPRHRTSISVHRTRLGYHSCACVFACVNWALAYLKLSRVTYILLLCDVWPGWAASWARASPSLFSVACNKLFSAGFPEYFRFSAVADGRLFAKVREGSITLTALCQRLVDYLFYCEGAGAEREVNAASVLGSRVYSSDYLS